MNRRKLRSKGMTRRMFYWNIQNMKSMYLNMRWIWRGDYSNESVSCCLWSDDWLSQFFVCGDIVILRWKFRGKRNKHWGFEYFVRSRINQPISFRGFGHVPCKWYVGCDERKKWRLKSEVIVRRVVGQDTWKIRRVLHYMSFLIWRRKGESSDFARKICTIWDNSAHILHLREFCCCTHLKLSWFKHNSSWTN